MAQEKRVDRPSTSETRADRPERVPLYAQRDTMSVRNKDDDKEYRWFNDRGNRIYRSKLAGWEHVTDESDVEIGEYKVEPNKDLGNIICRLVDDEGTKAYLMCIDKDLYDEDQARKAEEIDKKEEAMHAEYEDTSQGRYGHMKVRVHH